MSLVRSSVKLVTFILHWRKHLPDLIQHLFRTSPMMKKISPKLLTDECFKRGWKCQWRKSWRMAATRCALTWRPLYDSCKHYQCCFRIEVNKEWWGWDRGGMTYCLITCYQVGVPTQSHYSDEGGCHQEKSTQTNLSNTTPLNRPGTWVTKQFVAC